MISKAYSILVVLLFSTSAFAENAFEFKYELKNKKTGQKVSQGTFNAVEDQITRVKINNPLSPLTILDISIDFSYVPTMPGDGIDIMETQIQGVDGRVKHAINSDGNVTFAAKKITGKINITRSQSYYYRTTSGTIILDTNSESVLPGNCVAGNLNAAMIQIANKIVYSEDKDSVVVSDAGIEWDRTVKDCLEYSDETDERGGRICIEWDQDRIEHTIFPRCPSANL